MLLLLAALARPLRLVGMRGLVAGACCGRRRRTAAALRLRPWPCGVTVAEATGRHHPHILPNHRRRLHVGSDRQGLALRDLRLALGLLLARRLVALPALVRAAAFSSRTLAIAAVPTAAAAATTAAACPGPPTGAAAEAATLRTAATRAVRFAVTAVRITSCAAAGA